ncbi:MAG: UDP-N-acetylmuramate--L-alanine ligase [SAR86 cluster bacterium]|nr:UDP-N-acetylmuramate--L-alanine ligase [SAR86 cluster bacterium]
MNPSNYKLKNIHFIGIGGSGMCGIAEVLMNLGYNVSGSDNASSANTIRLEKLGISISYEHKPENLDNIEMVVRSTAILDDNPEIIEVKKRQIPLLARAEMLSSLMNNKRGIAVAGTHGKTTTTSLIASIMSHAELDPTFINGGIINSFNSSAQLGKGQYLIAEADESDQSFLLLQPSISVITNIEPDHLINYDNDFENLKSAFLDFIKKLPFNGVSIVCGDDEVINELKTSFQRSHISYGFNETNDYVLSDYKSKGKKSSFKITSDSLSIELTLNMLGKHNALNAAAAVVLCLQEEIPLEVIKESLNNFMGINRRMQILGEQKSENSSCIYIDDYGHHPTEIKKTIEAVRDSYPSHRLNMIFQPHRFTRTKDLFDEFITVLKDVDDLILLEIYSAGEQSIKDIDSLHIKQALLKSGFSNITLLENSQHTLEIIKNSRDMDTVFIFQGAGDISSISKQIVNDL